MCTVMIISTLILLLVGAGGRTPIYFAEGAAVYVPRQVVLEVLSAFRAGISSDPSKALASWDTSNRSSNPCTGDWAGLRCRYRSTSASDNTTILDGITSMHIQFKNKSLQGSITPMLSHLSPVLVSLDLSHNSLSGTFTFLSNFSSSTKLRSLTLDYNLLQGPFILPPPCFPRLASLSIAMNSFSGRLPSEALSRCTSLQFLNISYNNFIGPLFPGGLGNLTTALRALDASTNHLSGPIPPSIANCSMLTHLNLPGNNFSGHMPSYIGHGCPNLAFVSVFNNKLSGTLPPDIGLLSKLSFFSVGINSFSGDIFQILANCSALTTVDTSNDHITGQIPVDIGSRFPHLQNLNMIFNMLTGSIPESLGNCSHLSNLILGYNYNISGTVPAALFQAQNIIQLDLQFNSLSGPIPPEIGNLTSMQRAYLNNNHFTGSLPEQLSKLVSIQILTLEHNSLSGDFPNQLSNCTHLMGLGLHDNSLGGHISTTIGLLINLGSVDASSNKLTGQIPLQLSNCTSLHVISFSNNMLSGDIPRVVIANLLQCSSFDLSHNNLSGPIPDAEFGGHIFLETLDLSNNKLSGAVPSGLAGCVALASLDLSQNELAGPLPSAFGQSLQALEKLNLSHNSINGSIPTDLSGLNKSLQSLDLSFNALSGTIPSGLAQLESLQFLNLSYNSQLEGLIPLGGVFRNLTPTSFLGDPMLCGAAVNTTCTTSYYRGRHHSSPSSKKAIIGIAVAASLLLLGFLALILLYMERRRRPGQLAATNWDYNPYLKLSLKDIQEATGNFSEDNVLGAGVTGTVYRGTLKDGTTLAFKRFTLDESSIRSFTRELESVGSIRHRNLVRIMGYCSNQLGADSILILEHMANGSLEDHLHGGRNHGESTRLSWKDRLRVAVGVADGLLYLHNDCPTPVIHCDLKPQNILFDADMEVRITDFGIAKVMASAAKTSSFTENMQGTLGYMAPELASYGHISRKCDVYSYGVLLMELITGRRPFEGVQIVTDDGNIDEAAATTTTSLVQWVASMIEANRNINGIADEQLQQEANNGGQLGADVDHEQLLLTMGEQMKRILKLALHCTQEDPRKRPTMLHVVHTLFSITAPHDQQVPLHLQVIQVPCVPVPNQQDNSF